MGDGILFAAATAPGQEAGIYWSEPTGLAPLVMYPDGQLAGERVGSDGEDIVWTEVDFSSGDQWKYPRHLMTSKWSLDVEANMSTKRNLGIDIPYSDSSFLPAWAVGCGYAARTFRGPLAKDEAEVGMLRIVRLSDGATWSIKGGTPADPKGQVFYWTNVYGITCDEIWVDATNSTDSGFYRIRLDSLGPPTPAVQ